MGEASMRKWMRRARAHVAARMRTMPPGQSLAAPPAPGWPKPLPPATLGDWVRETALHMRREQRAAKMRARLRRSLAKATEIMRRAFASSIASMVSPNNALLRRLSLHA